ncbi:PAS domain-containing protein [Effusibacillus dendaii]|uniref:YheO-like domain-containing protein n=1 Tax=Effusibacillus dendaii TaxID=2743772 RepID=A0A7I8D846_9BACL|nr:PAS domain-containing protein [Effusibacillus dendaii]BCJ85542.1 hypothetical protein skT53_05270 [Effusibacillus dendaii]
MSQEFDNQINKYIARFIPIAESVAETFGSRCEIVLHDLTRPQSSVVYTKKLMGDRP